MNLRHVESERRYLEPQLPPHQGAVLFAERDTSRGFFSLMDVIKSEHAALLVAPKDLLLERYSPGAYLGSLVSEIGVENRKVLDYWDARKVDDAIRPAIQRRAEALGIDIERVA